MGEDYKEDYSFELGNLKISIYAPNEASYCEINNYSLVTLIQDRNLNYLFAGDAERVLLGELLKRDLPKVDLYKLPHHGRWNENTEAVIERISPRLGLVTNKEADERVISALKKQGADIYYAYDEDVYFYSDGKSIKKR